MEKIRTEKDVSPLELLQKKNHTTKEIRDSRMSICADCERIIFPTRTCKECNCFMPLKTWLDVAKCPLGKW